MAAGEREALDRHLDALLGGEAPPNDGLDPALAATLRSLATLARRPVPDPAFVTRLEGALATDPLASALQPVEPLEELEERTMDQGPLAVVNGASTGPNGRSPAIGLPHARRLGRPRHRWPLTELVVAAVVLLALATSLVAYRRSPNGPAADAPDRAGERAVAYAGVTPRASDPERWIEVDRDRQWLTAWQGDVVVRETAVSTGKPGAETPLGSYRIVAKVEQADLDGTVGGEFYHVPDVPWVMTFAEDGRSLHGTYWHNNFGWPVSYGGVDLPLDVAEWLYRWVPIGARVEIRVATPAVTPAAGHAATPAAGIAPVAIRIERAGVDARVEPLAVTDGVLALPDGPWVVGWYKDLAALGVGGNVIMTGHVDYWTSGPAVFWSLGQLTVGDRIVVAGADGNDYAYEVTWLRTYPTDATPDQVQEIVGPTGAESLTLITEGGEFDVDAGEYPERTVVRATLLSRTRGAAASPAASPNASPAAGTPTAAGITTDRAHQRAALLLIVDKSGSMSYDPLGGEAKIDMAKEAVRLAARSLDEGDLIGVLAFNDRQEWLVPMQVVVDEVDRRRIDAAIGTLTADGGTELLPALTAGLDAIRAVDADVRHVVVLSDGKSRTGTRDDYRQLLDQRMPGDATLSTIAIGEDADTDLLSFLAEHGGGRYHVAATAEEIPTLTVEETGLAIDPGTPRAVAPAD